MLETRIDKFIFRVREDLYYSETGLWVAIDNSRARVGLSDFAQQLNGDVAFASVRPLEPRSRPRKCLAISRP